MEVAIDMLENLYSKQEIINIEKRIAENLGCNIYKENQSVLLKLVQQNILKSNLEINEIQRIMLNESDNIIKFATQFLLEEKVENLSLGIGILYAIYWIYLSSKTEKELLDYLKLRRIPQAKKVVKQLQNVYNNLS